MRARCLLVAALVGVAALAVPGLGHPPSTDTHNGCPARDEPLSAPRPLPPSTVQGTLSWLGHDGLTHPTCWPSSILMWGSHASECWDLAYVGPAGGNYCGPILFLQEFAWCTWHPVASPAGLPTKLYIGWDHDLDGKVLHSDGEPVEGPYDPGSFLLVQTSFALARVIAFPTSVEDPPTGALDPAARHELACL